MRLAFIGCIHANVPALEAVLADAERQGATRVVCAGDVVGWGPEPREALALLRARGVVSIRGHDERRLLDRAPSRSTAWTLARLAAADVEAIGAWPLSYAFEAEGRTVVVVHGTPLQDDDSIVDATSEHRLNALLLVAGADVLVSAHTHVPLVRALGDRVIVNVGSVGRPFDGDVRAAYALVDVPAAGPPRVTFRRIGYDPATAVAAANEHRLPRRARDELVARASVLWSDEPWTFLSAVHRGRRRLGELAARSLEGHARALGQRARDGRERPADLRATHDVRVAARRLVTMLEVFGEALSRKKSAALARELRRLRKRLGPARDQDVGRALVADLDEDARRAALDALARWEPEAETERRAALERAADPELERRLKRLARSVSRVDTAHLRAAFEERAETARSRLDDALLVGTHEARHAFRLAAKQLRYVLEALAPIDPAARERAAAIAELQDALGAANDRVELARLLGQAGLDALAATFNAAAQRETDRFHELAKTTRARAALTGAAPTAVRAPLELSAG